MGLPIKIIAHPDCPPDVALLMPSSLDEQEKAQIWQRVLRGESPIEAAVSVLKRKMAMIKLPRTKETTHGNE